MTENFDCKSSDSAKAAVLQQSEPQTQPSHPLPVQSPADCDAAGHLLGDELTFLREANEQLVLSALRAHGLAEANAQLLIAAMSAQNLQITAEQAQQRQSEFLAVLVHELRNPLAPIRTAAALIEYLGDDPAQLREVQVVIERHVKRMTRLLDDLFDVARVNLGKLRVDRKLLDMSSLLQEVVNTYLPLLHQRRQKLNFQRPPHPVFVNGDSGRLMQVLSNLFDNASKYTPEGGAIELLVEVKDTVLVLTIADSGIGIAAEALSHIFEPFMQDAAAIGFNSAGLGIGLAVVRELIEAHKGSVIAHSAGRDLGSQFVITVPLAAHSPLSLHEISAAP
ncbi:MAG: HAMP domain-containing sensor histidine kinase [Spongiibacteraceae bacterium]